MSTNLITKGNTFISKRNSVSILEYKNCLEKYGTNFNSEISLQTGSPIFIDTNVFLRYYSISFAARSKLFDFINKYSDRIIIPYQVQIEFLRNREDVIQRFFEQVTNRIPKDFNSDIVNKTKNFLDQHKIVLKDYPFVEAGITQTQQSLETLMEKLNDTVEKKREEHLNLIVKDVFLDLLAKCTLLEKLTDEENAIVKTEFDMLKKDIGAENIDALFNKPNSTFPGLGDIKEKPEDPYGDYIIYHEMLKFMLNNSTDTLFLTFDNSKGDWMTKKRSPHLNYILNSFLNTNQILYIVDAERTLGELLDVNIDSLINEQTQTIDVSINVESLANLVEKLEIFNNVKIVPFPSKIVDELKMNGYSSIQGVEADLIRATKATLSYVENDNSSLNVIGILRVALRIANPLMTKYISANGDVKELPNKETYEKYRRLFL